MNVRAKIAGGAAALLVAAGVMFGAQPASAASLGVGTVLPSGHYEGAECLVMRAAPTNSSAETNCVPTGFRMQITCVASGWQVRGPYGLSVLWDYIQGLNGYLPDAFMKTGSSLPVSPPCGGPQAEPYSSQTHYRDFTALSWLSARWGTSAYKGLCETMVENAYGMTGQYASAKANYQDQLARGRIHTSGTPPYGALVFTKGSTPSLGHVEWSMGNNQFATSDATIHQINGPGSGYLGWSYVPDWWTGIPQV